MINPLFAGISMIRMLGEVNVSYVSPAHSDILILSMEYLLGRKVTKYNKVRRGCVCLDA